MLTELRHQVRFARGRFYIERQIDENLGSLEQNNNNEVIARITPLSDPEGAFLFEVGGTNHWRTITQGKSPTMSRTLTQRGAETFYGLGTLDASIRKARKQSSGMLSIINTDNTEFRYRNTDEKCSVQETLFHFFGLRIDVIAEPVEWYTYGRVPAIVEVSDDDHAILVQFSASGINGATFGGACLYISRDDLWTVYKIRPNQSGSIHSATQWLEKRNWKGW